MLNGHQILQPDILLIHTCQSITALEHECHKMWLAPNYLQVLTNIQTSMYYALQCATTTTAQISDISTLQYISKFHNFMHIISIQCNGAAITLSASGWICWQISGHIHFQPDFKDLNPVLPYALV